MTTKRRHLSAREVDALPAAFTQSFDIRAVEFIDRAHNPFAKNKILCRGSRLFWQNYPADFMRETVLIRSLFVHELCHVWQYETGRLSADAADKIAALDVVFKSVLKVIKLAPLES